MIEMAKNGKNSADVCATVPKDNVLPDDSDLNISQKSESSDLNDSRISNPSGAQSPASSTYADCEEIDSPTTTNENVITDETITKEPVIELKEVFVDTIHVDSNGVESFHGIENNLESVEFATGGIPEKLQIDDVQCSNEDQNYLEREVVNDRKSDGSVFDLNESDDGVYHEEEGNEDASNHSEHSDLEEVDDDRENGDGQETVQEEDGQLKKLDDDEDRRNPQYIPKRGFFYEHDDRTAGTGSEGEETSAPKEPAVVENPQKKGNRAIPDGRWQHDMYREDEQRSKNTQELIDIYGYDIRNEEAAPKARRRRKYGRGPKQYTRKWDDDEAYSKQSGKNHPARRQKPLPIKRKEYEVEFPSIDRRSGSGARSRERRPPPAVSTSQTNENVKSDSETKYRNDRRHTPPIREANEYPPEKPSRGFSKRIPTSRNYDGEFEEHGYSRSTARPQRTKFIVGSSGARGKGLRVGHGKPQQHYSNNYEGDVRPVSEMRNFAGASRGRSKRIDRPSQQYRGGKAATTDDDVRNLTEQMAHADLKSKKIISEKEDFERKTVAESQQNQTSGISSTLRSKRYSHQRQRLLPESNDDKNQMATPNVVSIVPGSQPVAHHMTAVMEANEKPTVAHQSSTASHSSAPLMSVCQMTAAPPPQNVTTVPLSAVNTPSMPSNSMAVSASLIPLNAPQMSASGAALQPGAPPLPIMGYFQHPQGFTNQRSAPQIYTREQNVMGGPSNQPVQLVAFLPATPMMSNNSHTQAAPPPSPPPPPPPPSIYPTSVISYPQAAPSQQTQASFNSETYTMPPVTLAQMHQPPEMYQSRGGVTYYNTRSQVNPRLPPPPRVKAAIPIVPPPGEIK